jgi:glycosyltransferase involved in cell wall biosynthesis
MISTISIIIPLYNRAATIGATLDSLLQQSEQEWESIVVDDGSTDAGIAVVEQYAIADSRIRFVQRPNTLPKGPNSCRNYGFSVSKGPWVYWLDSDDVLLPGALARYRAAFQAETDAVFAPLVKVAADTGEVIIQNTIRSSNLIEEYFTGEVSFYVCGPLWRRSFLERQPELFDPSLRNLDDWDFNLRMWYVQPHAVFLDTPAVQYRQHPNSLKQELAKGNPEEIVSAYRARFKHLALLTAQDPNNQQKYQRHIAHFYKKTLRQALIYRQKEWKAYYFATVSLLWEVKDWRTLLSVSIGTVSYLVFRRGYGFFE